MSEITQTLTLRGLDGESLDLAMAQALAQRGYTVFPPGVYGRMVEGKWETPGKLSARLGIHAGSLRRRMDRPDCPKPKAENLGLHGRRVSLISTPELDEFLTRNKKGGRL